MLNARDKGGRGRDEPGDVRGGRSPRNLATMARICGVTLAPWCHFEQVFSDSWDDPEIDTHAHTNLMIMITALSLLI